MDEKSEERKVLTADSRSREEKNSKGGRVVVGYWKLGNKER